MYFAICSSLMVNTQKIQCTYYNQSMFRVDVDDIIIMQSLAIELPEPCVFDKLLFEICRYQDFLNFQKMSSCRNWILMDDAEGDGTAAAWQRAKDDGIISEIRCLSDEHPTWHWELMAYQPGSRSWCIGFFNKEEDDCPRWRELAPDSKLFDLRKIIDPAKIVYNQSNSYSNLN